MWNFGCFLWAPTTVTVYICDMKAYFKEQAWVSSFVSERLCILKSTHHLALLFPSISNLTHLPCLISSCCSFFLRTNRDPSFTASETINPGLMSDAEETTASKRQINISPACVHTQSLTTSTETRPSSFRYQLSVKFFALLLSHTETNSQADSRGSTCLLWMYFDHMRKSMCMLKYALKKTRRRTVVLSKKKIVGFQGVFCILWVCAGIFRARSASTLEQHCGMLISEARTHWMKAKLQTLPEPTWWPITLTLRRL